MHLSETARTGVSDDTCRPSGACPESRESVRGDDSACGDNPTTQTTQADTPVVTVSRRERRLLAEKDSAKNFRAKPSLRDKAKLLPILIARQQEMEQMYDLLANKCEAVERLLAEHHGSDTVNEEQCRLCMVCGPVIRADETTVEVA